LTTSKTTHDNPPYYAPVSGKNPSGGFFRSCLGVSEVLLLLALRDS